MKESLKTYLSSCDEVENNLYLGNKASAEDFQLLNNLNIRRIVTVDISPLEKQLENVLYLHIYAEDNSEDDLLSHFDQCYSFIDETCLVHCLEGTSRGATIVAAYMMRKYSISCETAIDIIKAKRTCIQPNHGFIGQLKLYEQMGWRISRECRIYRNYLVENLGRRVLKNVSKIKELVQEYCDSSVCSVTTGGKSFKCKKCRKVVFTTHHVLRHCQKAESFRALEDLCENAHYVEPMQWMFPQIQELRGKIHCPSCKAKLGTFDWSGLKCSCGSIVRPGFRINASRIDESF